MQGDALPSILPYQWREFRRSSSIRQVFVEGRHGENDVMTLEFMDTIRQGFTDGRPIVEVVDSNGKKILFDFLRKEAVYLEYPQKTLCFRWIDERERVFSRTVVAFDEEGAAGAFSHFTDGYMTMTTVRRCDVYADRLSAFYQKMSGPAVYGWYGATADDIQEAAYGSGELKVNWSLMGSERAYGRGVHIATMSRMINSCLIAEPDNKGESHVIVCALLLGRQESVVVGSSQTEPSSFEYQTGVDDFSKPSWFIFWAERARTDVLPLFVVSFKKRNTVGLPPLDSIPTSPIYESDASLHQEVKNLIPSVKLHALEAYCESYVRKECSTKDFVKSLSVLGGDDVFAAVAKRLCKRR